MENPSATEPMDFSNLAPISVPVTYNGKQYVLKEASEDAGRQYRNAQLRETKMVDGKHVGFGNLADITSLLVSLCLFEVVGSTEKPVPLSTVRSWPARVVTPLSERAKQISNIDQVKDGEEKKEEEALKNGLSATVDTSA